MFNGTSSNKVAIHMAVIYIRLSVEIQDLLHGDHEVSADGRNAPLLMLSGFQRVFFSNWCRVSDDREGMYPNWISLPANMRMVQV
jgi:hypothetical protein